jgi:DNA-binding transcriptional LysR family regulator
MSRIKGRQVSDSLGAMSAFVRAAEARSFTDAGRQLGLSSSAIGKTVARLEARLGIRLFHRSTRSVTLTQEGRLFLESCRRIFSEMEKIELEFAQTQGAPRGRLRVSLPLVGMLMIPTLSRFMLAYPQIEMDMEFSDHLVDVIEGGYDVVVRTGHGADSRLKARKLGTYRLEVVGSPKYFKRAGTPSTPEDLVTHACLHHRYPTSGMIQRWPFAKSATGVDVALPMTAVATTVEALVALAEQGVGITCVPDFAIRRQVADGSLAIVLAAHLDHSGIFRALWPTSRYLAPKVRVFVDFLAEHLFAPASPAPKKSGARGARPGARPRRR